MPKVSVVIPVHNAEAHLRTCLDSLIVQTLSDIEIICVDDGSTDETPAILRQVAHTDGRVRLSEQPNAGAGAARNLGMEFASGDYLAFLDADDLFEPTMLASMYRQCVADRADIGICRVLQHDTSTGRSLPANHLLRTDLLPPSIPFSVREIPGHILDFTANATWNKLFKRSFILERDVRFQEIRRTNDLFFTNVALVKAERITIVDEALVHYRVGGDSSLQATNDEAPFDFYHALLALRDELRACDVYDELEQSFVNKALYTCLYNLGSLRTPESFYALYESLKNKCFTELGIAGRPQEYFYSDRDGERYSRIITSPPDTYLFEEVQHVSAELKATRWRLRAARDTVRKIRRSRSYRVARRAAWYARRAKDLLRLGS